MRLTQYAMTQISKNVIKNVRQKLEQLIRFRLDSYAAMGDGGNVIYVNSKKKIVISIVSLFIPHARDRIKLMKEYIEPVFDN